jgi:cystathionine beta-synthase
MQANGFDQLPVIGTPESNNLIGLVTLGGILAKIGSGRAKLEDPAELAMYSFKVKRHFMEITLDTPLESMSKFFEKNSCAIVTSKNESGQLKVVSIITKVDLLGFLVKQI